MIGGSFVSKHTHIVMSLATALPNANVNMCSPFSNRRSPDSAIFLRVRNIGNDRRTIQEGTFEVTSNDLIYVDSITHVKLQWPLRYLRRYGSNGDTFTFEAGTRCQSGPGVYTFATPQGMQIQNIVARNMSILIQSPLSSRNQSPDPSFILSSTPTSSASPFANSSRQNGHSTHLTSTPSPLSSPSLSRSSSMRSLPENVFEVKNISDDQTVVQEGFLEVTATDIFYSDPKHHRIYQWPLVYLRKFGCDGHGDIFSIEAGRRCPGGEGLYAFKTPQASVLSELVQTNTRGISSSGYFGSLMSLDATEITSPFTPASYTSSSSSSSSSSRAAARTSYQPIQEESSSPKQRYYEPLKQSSTSPTSSSPVFKRTDSLLRRAFSAQELDRDIFDVRNISEDNTTVGMGTLEVTNSELVYIDASTQEKWRWPIKYLRKYGCDGNVFTIEAGRRCKGGAGIYAFETPRASELNEVVIGSILKQNTQFTNVGKAQSISRLSLADHAMFTNSPMHGAGRTSRSVSMDVGIGAAAGPTFLTPPPPGRARTMRHTHPEELTLPQPVIQLQDAHDTSKQQQQQQQQQEHEQQSLLQEQQQAKEPGDISRSSMSSPDGSMDTGESSSLSSGTNTPTSPPAKPPRKARTEKANKKLGSPQKKKEKVASQELAVEEAQKSSVKLRKKSKDKAERSSTENGSLSPKKKFYSWVKKRSSSVAAEDSSEKQEGKPLKNGRPRPTISYPIVQNVYLNINTSNAKLCEHLGPKEGSRISTGEATDRAGLQYQNLTEAQGEAQTYLHTATPPADLVVDKAGLQYQNLTEAQENARTFLHTKTPSPDLVDKAGLQYQNLTEAQDNARTFLHTKTPSPDLVDKAGLQYQNLTEAQDNARTFLHAKTPSPDLVVDKAGLQYQNLTEAQDNARTFLHTKTPSPDLVDKAGLQYQNLTEAQDDAQTYLQHKTSANATGTCYAIVDIPNSHTTTSESVYAELAVRSHDETDGGSHGVTSPSQGQPVRNRSASYGEEAVEYSRLNFNAMSVVAQLHRDHDNVENFAGLLERHNVREKEVGANSRISRKKK